ncbi:hypothetical protein NQ318_020835 [Aromia moschata]|uniref:Transposase n=1 Tax=Aromia moschata TaxID=1265417 RepID=A0AAV8X698_9CUCU|nr:hypothetical protein NQ318_020835 [Aromia moschata]
MYESLDDYKSESGVERTVRRFEETGHIKDPPKSGRTTSATNPEKSLDTMLSFIEDPHSSIRRSAQQHEISKGSIGNILKRNKFHPCKVKLVHELIEDDPDRRIEFCETMIRMIDEDPHFLFNIVFSDEATFQLDGNLNRHNCRYWSDSNPRLMREHNTQYREKLNVWAGILHNHIVGPFFIEGNLNAEAYEDKLRNEIVPAISQIAGQNFEEIWYQHDGAPAHYDRAPRTDRVAYTLA